MLQKKLASNPMCTKAGSEPETNEEVTLEYSSLVLLLEPREAPWMVPVTARLRPRLAAEQSTVRGAAWGRDDQEPE